MPNTSILRALAALLIHNTSGINTMTYVMQFFCAVMSIFLWFIGGTVFIYAHAPIMGTLMMMFAVVFMVLGERVIK
jgi:hypothetical protein